MYFKIANLDNLRTGQITLSLARFIVHYVLLMIIIFCRVTVVYQFIILIDFLMLINVFFNFDDIYLLDCWELAVL